MAELSKLSISDGSVKNTDTERRDRPKPKVFHHVPRSTTRGERYDIPAHETTPISQTFLVIHTRLQVPIRPGICLLMPQLISVKPDLLVHVKQEGAGGGHGNRG